jgi:uncharacterized ParB-like nuclease family protein
MTPTKIALSKIRIDGGTQPRCAIDQKLIEEYRESLDQLPPVDLCFDGTDYWLFDGFHRYWAFEASGRKEIPSLIRHGTQRSAVKLSLGANHAHGSRRTNEDKRKAVQTCLADREWGTMSNYDQAEICAVAESFVRKIKKEIEESSLRTVRSETPMATPESTKRQNDVAELSPATETKVVRNKHGSKTVMKVGKIGKSKQPAKSEPAPKPEPIVETVETIEVPTDPWSAYEARVRKVMTDLRGAAKELSEIFKYDSATKQIRERWAQTNSAAGTIGQILGVVRGLDQNMPAQVVSGGRGYLTASEVQIAKSVKAA